MTLSVRNMQLSDIDAIYSIEKSAHRAPWSRAILAECLLAGFDCRVLEKDASIISYIICRYKDNNCHILNLCVAPAYQNQGNGKFLLQTVFNSLADKSATAIVLEVRPSNIIALNLYKKLGFEQIAIKRGYYREEETKEDAIFLEKKI